jgi:hypothetical protein
MLIEPVGESPEKRTRLVRLAELCESERRFLRAIQSLEHGRFEFLKIDHSQLVLDPWPTTVRYVKFCAKTNQSEAGVEDFLLKQQVVELFEHVRSVYIGEIRILEVKNSLPFSMEIDLHRNSAGGRHA